MTKALLTLFGCVSIGSGALAADLEQVNACESVARLNSVLQSLSGKKDEDSQVAFLWGAILCDGFRPKATKYPVAFVEQGKRLFDAPSTCPRLNALKLWWWQTIGSVYVPPDFKRGYIAYYGTVLENGKVVKVPIYASHEEEEVHARLDILKAAVLKERPKFEESLLYLWWQRDPKTAPSTAEVEGVANGSSPWRAFAVGELALRERLRLNDGPWTAKWRKIVKANKSLAIQAVRTEMKETLTAKPK